MATAVERRADAERRPTHSWWSRSIIIVPAVAAVTFALAFDEGTYSLSSRSYLAIAVWWIVALAWGSGGWPSKRPTAEVLAVVALLAALAAWTALSAVWAHDLGAVHDEVVRVLLYLGVVLLVAAFVEWEDLRSWADGFAVGIALVGLVALASRLFPSLIGVDARYEFLSETIARLSYPVGYWNGLAILAALSVPLLLRAATGASAAVVRAAAAAGLVPVAAVVYLTSSRAGAIAALVGGLTFFVLAPRRWRSAAVLVAGVVGAAATIWILRRAPALVDDPTAAAAADQGESTALLLAVAALLTAVVHWLGAHVADVLESRTPERVVTAAVGLAVAALIVAARPLERIREFKELPAPNAVPDVREHLLSGSGNGRWQYWEVAWGQFREQPLQGEGAGSFHEAWQQERPISSFVLDAHSLYVETLGELGVVGFALVAAIAAVAVTLVVRRTRGSRDADRSAVAALSAALAGFGVALAVDWMWELTAVSVVGIALLTLLASASPLSPAAGRASAAARAGVAATAVIAIVLVAIPLLASLRLEASYAAARRGEPTEALSEARAARDVQPWSAAPYLQLALVEEQAGRLEPARAWLVGAQERDPRNAALWLVAARLDTKLGRIAAARSDLARARELNPFLSLPQ